MGSETTLYWHDYETFGSNPRRDRPCQFAGIRTDTELNIIDDGLVMYCRPAPDFLPQPEACAVTGITPQTARDNGVCEAEFCERIAAEFLRPGTCVAGYNSIRFDDEVTRHLLYRCLRDPYEREWKHGNSRWDIIDMVRLTHGVRPEGIHWPVREDGFTSFRLEDLTRENGIGHEEAHDAMADVRATIEVARLIKNRQPRLYDFLFQRRNKQQVMSMLEPAKREPVLHVSGMYPASRGCLAVVIPVVRHEHNRNEIIVYDLTEDPAEWLELSVDEIRDRLFTPADSLPEGVRRIGLKTIHINKCPAVAPLSVLDDVLTRRWGIDLPQCRQHLEKLEAGRDLEQKLRAVFSRAPESLGEREDPDHMLYSGGFFSEPDKKRMLQIHNMLPSELAAFSPGFDDPRLEEMLFRYRARNYPETLRAAEQGRWLEFCRQSLESPEPLAGVGRRDYDDVLGKLEQEGSVNAELIASLREYALELDRLLAPTDSSPAEQN